MFGNKMILKRKKRKKLSIIDVIFLPLSLLWCYPFFWMVSNSVKTPKDMMMNGLTLFTANPTLENFSRAWTAAKFDQYLINSVIITLGVVALVLTVASTAGYGLSKNNVPGKKIILGMLLITMFFPKSVSILPIYQIINAMGINNSYFGIILAIAGPAHVMAILLFMKYFATVPRELEESAIIDGAKYHHVFLKIMLPLSKPIFATVGIFNFVSAWNDFMVPLVFTLNKPELRTLGVGLYAFFGEGTTDWTGLSAAATMAILPIMIVFLFFQRFFIEGLEGAVKG